MKKWLRSVLTHGGAFGGGAFAGWKLRGAADRPAIALLNLYAGAAHSNTNLTFAFSIGTDFYDQHTAIRKRLKGSEPGPSLFHIWQLWLSSRMSRGFDAVEIVADHAQLSSAELRSKVIGYLADMAMSLGSEDIGELQKLFDGLAEEYGRRANDAEEAWQESKRDFPRFIESIEDRATSAELKRRIGAASIHVDGENISENFLVSSYHFSKQWSAGPEATLVSNATEPLDSFNERVRGWWEMASSTWRH